MTENDDLLRLVSLIGKFEKLDASLQNGGDDFWNIFSRTLEAKKQIKRFLSRHQPLKVNNSLGTKLKKIRDNYGYVIDELIDGLSQRMGKQLSQEVEADDELDDEFFTLRADDHVVEGYYTRKNEVGTLIVNETLPEHFVHHFETVRDCYALGLFQATLIYCRAVIEAGCFEALRRKGKVSRDPKIEDFREFNLKALMNSIKPFVYMENWNKADRLIKKANKILHSKKETTGVTKTDAYNAIKDTFAIVEELFSAGVHKNKQRR